MIRRALLVLSILFPLAASAAADAPAAKPGAPRPLSDYDVILERKMFGDPAAAAAAAQAALPPVSIQESFAATLRLSGIYELDDGNLRVAISDKKDNSYFALRLDEGPNAEGISLVEADYKKGEAVLQKGDEVVVLSMDANENKVLSSEEKSQRAEEAQKRRMSYAERRRLRKEARAKAMEEARNRPRLSGPELEEHLQNYQMEVLRTGLPPLPVQLTPDRDAQLVAEGVLPPQDEEGYEIDGEEYEEDPAGYDEYGAYYLD